MTSRACSKPVWAGAAAPSVDATMTRSINAPNPANRPTMNTAQITSSVRRPSFFVQCTT
jgi:hypothetical protein